MDTSKKTEPKLIRFSNDDISLYTDIHPVWIGFSSSGAMGPEGRLYVLDETGNIYMGNHAFPPIKQQDLLKFCTEMFIYAGCPDIENASDLRAKVQSFWVHYDKGMGNLESYRKDYDKMRKFFNRRRRVLRELTKAAPHCDNLIRWDDPNCDPRFDPEWCADQQVAAPLAYAPEEITKPLYDKAGVSLDEVEEYRKNVAQLRQLILLPSD